MGAAAPVAAPLTPTKEALMGYICTKPMKVQVAPGQLEQRMPGDAVPEAETWANPKVWIQRGFIAPDNAETASRSGYSRAKLIPAREATPEDAARSVSYVPPPVKPKSAAPPAHEMTPEEGDTKAELMRMTRAEMEEFATTNTTLKDPGSYSNKEALADAILATAGE